MKILFKITALIMVCIFIGSNLISCIRFGPSDEFIRMKEQGFYPDTADFPDTVWVCREVDMTIYMTAYEGGMIGELKTDSGIYRVDAYFFYSRMCFDFYSSTSVTINDYPLGYAELERIEAGFLVTEYIYKDGVISCEIINSDTELWAYSGDTITFEQKCKISDTPISEWYCEELDLYLAKYIDGYYKGEIIIDNIPHYIQAIEIGNGEYYTISIENGITNNLRENTLSPFVDMYFEYKGSEIVAYVSNDVNSNRLAYDWQEEGSVFVFKEVKK